MTENVISSTPSAIKDEPASVNSYDSLRAELLGSFGKSKIAGVAGIRPITVKCDGQTRQLYCKRLGTDERFKVEELFPAHNFNLFHPDIVAMIVTTCIVTEKGDHVFAGSNEEFDQIKGGDGEFWCDVSRQCGIVNGWLAGNASTKELSDLVKK